MTSLRTRIAPAATAATAAALVFALLAGILAPAWAQQPSGTAARRLLASRALLEQTLDSLRQLKDSRSALPWVDAEIAFAERRLDSGDFKVGDRVVIAVEDPLPRTAAGGGGAGAAGGAGTQKSPEEQLTDTFTVNGAQALMLPMLGAVPMHGVLRSEVEPYLTNQIATQIRDPYVHARALVVVAVSGGVLRPGYYSIPADALVGKAIDAAGGGALNGKITELKIVHNGATIWEGQALRNAISEGKTLDDLRVQPGDQIAVGQKSGAAATLGMIALILSIPVAILSLTHY
jgi:hypothetical protein